jgi:hypothetical protein
VQPRACSEHADLGGLRILNRTRSSEIASAARRADDFGSRLVGLMGSPGLPEGGALVLEPCASIHSCFMRFPIDVLFLDRRGVVVGLIEAMRPWRLSRIYRGARIAIELPAGTIAASATSTGDEIQFESVG